MVLVAFRVMPLADAQAIFSATPLLVTALSVPFLGERVGWRRWLAVACGFVGVLVIVRPGLERPPARRRPAWAPPASTRSTRS